MSENLDSTTILDRFVIEEQNIRKFRANVTKMRSILSRNQIIKVTTNDSPALAVMKWETFKELENYLKVLSIPELLDLYKDYIEKSKQGLHPLEYTFNLEEEDS